MKVKKLKKNCSIALPSLFLVIVQLCPAVPASAQEGLAHCQGFVQTVIDLRSSDRATDRDILASRLLAAQEAQSCLEEAEEVQWVIWLMHQEIVALNGLQRYAEAQAVVDAFFRTYTTRADSSDVARFYMWDLRFKHFDGRFTEALESYRQGLPYAPKLPEEWYKQYLLNAGSVYMAEGQFKESLNVYREVSQTFIGTPSLSEGPLFEVYGRALLGEAEASLDLVLYTDEPGIDLDQVIRQLSRAASIFNLAESHERHAAANSALALAHTLSGGHRDAGVFLDLASLTAERKDLRREHIALGYRRALIRLLKKQYDAALTDIEEALSLSQRYNIGEFETRLHYLKGQTYEEAGQPKEALAAYEETFNTSKDSSQGRDRRLFELAAASAFRIGEISKEPAAPFAFLTLGFFGVVLAIAFFALLAYFVVMGPRQREKRHALPGKEPPPPEEQPPPRPPQPTVSTPSVITSYFPKINQIHPLNE